MHMRKRAVQLYTHTHTIDQEVYAHLSLMVYVQKLQAPPLPSEHDLRTEYRGMPGRRVQLSAPLLPAERPCDFITSGSTKHRRM